ncbi:HAD-IC family P-type ATPase [Spiroplasma endosymbiont of Panorpa germanica]|uniref:HAD-IC family P-type ATPase n=1 Tax=Spiroplasma endosymbiont of Panorpa germanica TaxID=3066314 RepID=UPI0030D33357
MKKNSKFSKSDITDKILTASKMDINDLKKDIDVVDWGLDEEEVFTRRRIQGENVPINKTFNHFQKIITALFAPFNLLLWFIAIIQIFIYFTQGYEKIDIISFSIIIFMVVLSASVDYIQDFKAYKMNQKLTQLIDNNVFVLREKVEVFFDNNNPKMMNNLKMINEKYLTVGDVVYLSAGDKVPADARILWSNNLTADQSDFTGESEWIQKSTSQINESSDNVFELSNIIFQNSKITSGSCYAVIFSIGKNTYANLMSEEGVEDDVTEYELGLKKVTKILLLTLLIVFPVVFLILFFKTGLIIGSLVFAISLIVSITPESLPAIMTLNLHEGAKRLKDAKIVVKNNSTTQTLGAIDILCTDKTGTLTDSQISLHSYLDLDLNKSNELLEFSFLNSYFQSNISNAIDKAILEQNPFDEKKIEETILIDEIPFNHERRMVSTLLLKDKKYLQITKGGIDEIIQTLGFLENEKKSGAIKNPDKDLILKKAKVFSDQGYRVVGLAFRESLNKFEVSEIGLTFLGFLIFTDNIKKDVDKVVELIYKNNVDLKILTGDSVDNSLLVAKNVGLNNPQAILGKDLEGLKQNELKEVALNYNVFCKLTPFQKSEIIKTLQDEGHCVGFLGDGVNDAKALRQSDVGISVNTGSPIAKASADAIMLEKDLLVLEKAFLQGRHIFTNAIKYIKISVTNNFSLMLTLIIALLWFDFKPMLPLHLLMQNLLYDFTNLIFVWDNVDKELIVKPKKWSTKSILPFAIFNAIAATTVSIINFLIIGYGFGLVGQINAGDTEALKMFQAAFFIESFLTHMIISIVYRTEKISIWQSNVNWIILFIISGFTIIVFGMVFIPNLNNSLGFKAPPAYWLAIISGLMIAAWSLGEINKKLYIQIFKKWI